MSNWEGKLTVLRNAPVNYGRAQDAASTNISANDPAAQQQMRYLAALEAKYAQQAAGAQQQVQNAQQMLGADPIMWDARTKAAAMDRARMMQQAAIKFNAALPAGTEYGMRKSLTDFSL